MEWHHHVGCLSLWKVRHLRLRAAIDQKHLPEIVSTSNLAFYMMGHYRLTVQGRDQERLGLGRQFCPPPSISKSPLFISLDLLDGVEAAAAEEWRTVRRQLHGRRLSNRARKD